MGRTWGCTDGDVVRLTALVRDRLGSGPFVPAAGWQHVGAVLTDAVLQAAMRYATVKGRVQGLVRDWPDADTLTRFRSRIATTGLAGVLNWRGPKLDTIVALADRLASEDVDGHPLDTVHDLGVWLSDPRHVVELRSIKGVGNKTANYLCSMAGLSEVAIDTHLRAFAAQAGATGHGDAALHSLYRATAECMGVDPGGLDYAVWQHLSSRSSDR